MEIFNSMIQDFLIKNENKVNSCKDTNEFISLVDGVYSELYISENELRDLIIAFCSVTNKKFIFIKNGSNDEGVLYPEDADYYLYTGPIPNPRILREYFNSLPESLINYIYNNLEVLG